MRKYLHTYTDKKSGFIALYRLNKTAFLMVLKGSYGHMSKSSIQLCEMSEKLGQILFFQLEMLLISTHE